MPEAQNIIDEHCQEMGKMVAEAQDAGCRWAFEHAIRLVEDCNSCCGSGKVPEDGIEAWSVCLDCMEARIAADRIRKFLESCRG